MTVDQAGAAWLNTQNKVKADSELGHATGLTAQKKNEGCSAGAIMEEKVRVWVNLRCCEQVLI